jgi:serine acetyltransferase
VPGSRLAHAQCVSAELLIVIVNYRTTQALLREASRPRLRVAGRRRLAARVGISPFRQLAHGLRRRWLRAPATVVYRALQTGVHYGFGIKLDNTVKLGLRVRIWHHSGMVLGARSIGDDVCIRHNTTFVVARRSDLATKPVIGDRVEVGCGAAILGDVRVGEDSVIGANAVVTQDLPARSLAVGVPAQVLPRRRGDCYVSQLTAAEDGERVRRAS